MIPISSVNCSGEPMVIRKGERVAVGTKLAEEQVERVEEQAGALGCQWGVGQAS